MNIITLTLQLPEGFQLPEAARTEVSVQNAAGAQISASGGQGSNMAPKEPVAQQPWQYRFLLDPKTTPVGRNSRSRHKRTKVTPRFFLKPNRPSPGMAAINTLTSC